MTGVTASQVDLLLENIETAMCIKDWPAKNLRLHVSHLLVELGQELADYNIVTIDIVRWQKLLKDLVKYDELECP